MKYKLRKIVEEYLLESLGETTLHKYPRLLQIAISGLREMNTDVEGIIKTVELPVGSNDTVSLPSDFIDYRLIGVCSTDGTIQSLGLNANMCPPLYDDCGNLIGSPERSQDVPFYGYDNIYSQGSSFRNGESIGRRFGQGGGYNKFGYYRVWKDRGYITLTNFTGGSIILEYLGDIDTVDENYMVHPYMVEAIKSWIYWKYIQRKPQYSGNEKMMARREYYNQKYLAKKRTNMVNVKELMDAMRKYYGMTPHF